MRFRFGDFVFDIQRQELCRQGVEIPLEPKAFQVLNHLLMYHDRAVSKEELHETCWQGEFVTDSAIVRCLKVIRQAVDDDGAQQHTIKTLRSYGYRFIAPVEVDPSAAVAFQDQAAALYQEQARLEGAADVSPPPGAENGRAARYAVLMGNGHYPLAKHLPDLQTPERDVDGLAEVLADSQIAQFQDVQRLKNCSHDEAFDALVRRLHTAQKDDLVLIYLAGHAWLSDQDRLHLAFVNTQTHRLDATSLEIEQIKDAIDTCQSTRIVIILDCCFSQEPGASGSPDALTAQLRWLASGRGKYILSTAPTLQEAQEKQTETYRTLTQHLIEGLRTGNADLDHCGSITMDQLYQYVFTSLLETDKPVPVKWDLSGKGRLILATSRHRLNNGIVSPTTAVRAHYDAIAQLFKKGDVIPFLGPGVVERALDPSPPIGRELAQRLADSAGFGDSADPLTLISQKIHIVAGRGVLYDNLRDIYQPDPYVYRPAPIHLFLARLPHPLLMFSTTYDTLLEDAFDEMGKKYVVVTHILHADSPDRGKVAFQYSDRKETVEKCLAQELVIDLSTWSVIYKLHGTFGLLDPEADEEIDSIVIAEEDYLALVKLLDHPQSTIPNHLARQFKKRMFLFLGYGLSDWNCRAVVDVIEGKGNFRRIQPYAVHETATEFERLYWESKRVRLLQTDLHAFIRELADATGIDV